MSDLTIHRQYGASFEVTFEGRHAFVFFPTLNPDAMVAQAADELARAEEITRRARRTLAIAQFVRNQRDRDAVEARTSRNAKAAATRARNADPFGFEALETRS